MRGFAFLEIRTCGFRTDLPVWPVLEATGGHCFESVDDILPTGGREVLLLVSMGKGTDAKPLYIGRVGKMAMRSTGVRGGHFLLSLSRALARL